MLNRREPMSEAEVLGLFEACSNEGKWGPDDELGTLNYITPQKRIEAAGLVRSGTVVSLAADLSRVASKKNAAPVIHKMLYVAHSNPITCLDAVEITPHGMSVTHQDAVGHVYFEGKVYNGRRAADIATGLGMSFGSIFAQRDGVVTRGVLLDVAAARGVDWLRPDEGVWPEDLDAAEKLAGTTVGAGDAIVIRIGLGAREAVEGEEDPTVRAGLMAECVPWIHQRQVSVYAGDCVERIPLPFYSRVFLPLHMIGMVAMGLAMIDNTAVEELARTCRKEGRCEFLLVSAPLRLPGATATAVNPVAIF